MKLQERHVLSCLVLAWLVVGDHASRRHVYREDLLCGVPPFCLRLTSLLSMSSRVFRSFPNRYYCHGWSAVCSNILRGTTTAVPGTRHTRRLHTCTRYARTVRTSTCSPDDAARAPELADPRAPSSMNRSEPPKERTHSGSALPLTTLLSPLKIFPSRFGGLFRHPCMHMRSTKMFWLGNAWTTRHRQGRRKREAHLIESWHGTWIDHDAPPCVLAVGPGLRPGSGRRASRGPGMHDDWCGEGRQCRWIYHDHPQC